MIMIPLRDMLPSRRFPFVTVSLIVLNLLIFLFQGYLGMQAPYREDWTQERAEWAASQLEEPPIFNPAYAATTGQRILSSMPSVYEIGRDEWFQTQYAL
ncbi:hypothetical protein IH601_00805, partial [Candidatus Bipolaricaulota bacterium]|nr:hypothetical protein [Candidatus Bipolaricaulota bacterium]